MRQKLSPVLAEAKFSSSIIITTLLCSFIRQRKSHPYGDNAVGMRWQINLPCVNVILNLEANRGAQHTQ